MPKRNKRAIIIGGGIGGLATAILLAKQGYSVSLYERLDTLGGRARQFQADGFTFDMGPSWYLMPGVFKHFYELIGEDITEHLQLERLRPAYKVFFENSDPLAITGEFARDAETFETVEPGAGDALRRYLQSAEKTYNLAVESFLYSNFSNATQFSTKSVIKNGPAMAAAALTPLEKYVGSFVRDQRLKQVLEYPMVFLGASPFKAPAIYHLMSHLDFTEGVYYPRGGMHQIITSLVAIAKRLGVHLHTGAEVEKITSRSGRANGVMIGGEHISADVIISNADMQFSETTLLKPTDQTYPESYWKKRTAGPSALLLYLGIKGELPNLEHHNLFFTNDWRGNFEAIFNTKTLPDPASMYVCKPSATDAGVAPKGHENVFVLMPLPAKPLSEDEKQAAIERCMNQLKTMTSEPELESRVVYRRAYTPNDFAADYHAWQGSALGLSHTLRQSAFLRPRNKSNKLDNAYYVGGNTIPGIGLPMCLISAELIVKHLAGEQTSGPLAALPERRA